MNPNHENLLKEVYERRKPVATEPAGNNAPPWLANRNKAQKPERDPRKDARRNVAAKRLAMLKGQKGK